MNAKTMNNYAWWLEEMGKGNHQKTHQIRRSAFSAFVFQIIGNKHEVMASIQHPISSAAQPAKKFQDFMSALEDAKSSDDYKKRMQISERLTRERRAEHAQLGEEPRSPRQSCRVRESPFCAFTEAFEHVRLDDMVQVFCRVVVWRRPPERFTTTT